MSDNTLTLGDIMFGIKEPKAPAKPEPSPQAIKRRETVAVTNYLQSLAEGDPELVVDRLKRRLENAESKLNAENDPVARLDKAQKVVDLKREIHRNKNRSDFKSKQEEFIKVAKSYSERKGISYSAWRMIGVPAQVLRDAEIPRTRIDE